MGGRSVQREADHPQMKAKVEHAKADIIAGKIKVQDYMEANSCSA
jgi:hypothetical protein